MKLSRWIALAAFCLAFGFLGSVGGLAVMNGHVRGPAGQDGPTGAPGRAGPTGQAGGTGTLPANLVKVDNALTNLMNEQRALSTRLDELQPTSGVVSSCVPTQVVSSVEWNRFASGGNSPLIVRKTSVCVQIG